ncbi:MAG: molecular chaperone HtpG [Clostridia bacterium]|nr:molecular chaperone HtpG [Clostridia bacterium]
MQKKQFKAESKRLLDLMVNSIYTHKEIFLRELISNASDAIDKMYYKALTDSSITFNREDYFIRIEIDKNSRTLKIIDSGIGMTKEELEDNLGTLAKSGSFDFKKINEAKEDVNIIGQFGVGFYSAFMVADNVKVISRAYGEESGHIWESDGASGFTIGEYDYDRTGTEIILTIKNNTDDENYDEFFEEYRLRSLVKKYSDFIRYPIKMLVSKSRLKEGSDKDYEQYFEDETLNSMVPIWRKNKSELKDEDYFKFYTEKHYGFEQPLKYLHINAEGTVSYKAVLYIPKRPPFDYYTKEFQKGLELYSSSVLIMNKCGDLLPDYFGFVQGLVDSENLSLNISRELLQHDRQLKFIAKNIKEKIKSELLSMQKDQRDVYDEFYKGFGRTLKYGIYSGYGANREMLEELIMFYSSKDKKLVTLSEYVERMPKEQKYIYFVSGDNMDRLLKLPQTEAVIEKGFEILLLCEDVDEFAVRMLAKYKDKEFKSVSDSGDIGIDDKKENKTKDSDDDKKMLKKALEILKDKVKDVRLSKKLKSHAVCITTEGEMSMEMKKVISQMPSNEKIKANKVLEINKNHKVFEALKAANSGDEEKFKLIVNILYNQALLIEGVLPEDTIEFAEGISKLIAG